MSNSLSRNKRLALFGIFAAIAIVLSFFENALLGMTNFFIPGLKPGIANIAVVMALAWLGGREAFVISLIKATASFLATGAITVLWFSLAGAVLSCVGMVLLHRTKLFSLAGVSAAGGFLSNLAQVGVMILISGTKEFLYYLPLLALFGVGFGLLIGIVCNLIYSRLNKVKKI